MADPPSRRFPPPWRMIEKPGCFQVQDATGHAIGWFYFRHDDGAARQASVLTHDEARRMAVNFTRLPDLLTNPDRGSANTPP